MALNFPWEMFVQAQEAKNRNRQQMYQDMAGIGQSLGQGMNAIGQAVQEKKKRDVLNQLMQAMRSQGAPQQGPQMPGSGQTPTSGMGAPGQDNSQLINSLMMQYDPTTAMSRMPTPLQQSEIAKNNAMAQRYSQGGPGSKSVGTLYRNSATGEMTDDPVQAGGPEWKAYKTTQGDVLNKLAGQTSGKARNAALSSRAEVMARGIDARQIDRLAQTVGVTPAQRNLLQQNNMRANRAIELASRPMTWQEFNNVLTDAAAIMQGGVPHIDQIHNMTYPTWQEQFARYQTVATSQPTMNVPPEIRNRVISMVQGIQKIDNQYLTKNAEFMQKMLGPTIRGGIGQFQKPIADMTNAITQTAGQGGGQPQQGGWTYVGPAQ